MGGLQNYIRRETAIGIVINLAIGTFFFFLMFRGQQDLAVWGPGGLMLDCLPQGFMMGLMSVIPAMLITAQRRKKGLSFEGLMTTKPKLPRNVFIRALCVALISLVSLVGVAAALATVTGAQSVPFWLAFALKSLPAVVITSMAIPPAIRVALTNPAPAAAVEVGG